MYPFWKITPGGNPTVLLRAEDVPPALRARVAGEIMDPLHLGGEQVGFVRFKDKPRLDMMGGEFCLNATRAFAALLARAGLLPETNQGWKGEVEVSGAGRPVGVRVEPVAGRADAWTAWARLLCADMPAPQPVAEGVTLARVPGISHLVLENTPPPSAGELAEICAGLRARLALENEEAVGFLWLDADAAVPAMHPVVWVRETQTLCRESACGSGTLACAWLLRKRTGQTSFAIRQPSGHSLRVDFAFGQDGAPSAWVGGPVRLSAEGLLSLTSL